MDNTVGSLTQFQKSLIVGTLLGDGYLRIVPGRKDAFLEVNHSIVAKEYVDWKYENLKSIVGSEPKIRNGNGRRIAYRFYTRQHPEITELFNEFYLNGKKIIPENLRLDPVSLAVWYMDDGSKCRERDVYLNTQQFEIEEQYRLVRILQEFNVNATLQKDKTYQRLRLLKESIAKFFNIIRPHIVPSMHYKLNNDPVET